MDRRIGNGRSRGAAAAAAAGAARARPGEGVMATGLLIAAFVLFVVEALRTRSLTAAGLACWVLSEILYR